MAKIYPFRGIHYDINIVGDLSKVVAQPYDQINDKLRETYYARHPFHLTRIIKGRTEPDTDKDNVYSRGGDYLAEWMRDGVLKRDEKPAIYAYHQEYKVDDEIRVRKGFVALAKLEAYGEGVKAHERTLAAPKQDRFNLMVTTEANTGQIFMLYSEPERLINKALDTAIVGKEPDFLATDDFGCIHKMWRVTDKKAIREVKTHMEPMTLFIADGHHRYETAVNYMTHMKKLKKKCVKGATENFNNCMMTFVNVDEPGLTILPTHRLIYGLEDQKVESLLNNAMEYFTIEHFPLGDNDEKAVKNVLDAMKTRQKNENLFGLYMKGDNEIKLLSLKDNHAMENLVPEMSDDWKKLDIAILHTILMDKFLGIDREKLEAKTNVEYFRDPVEPFKKARDDDHYQLVFLVNPTGVEQVKKVAANGERMPQKSTDFFPKLLSGMIMNKMMIE